MSPLCLTLIITVSTSMSSLHTLTQTATHAHTQTRTHACTHTHTHDAHTHDTHTTPKHTHTTTPKHTHIHTNTLGYLLLLIPLQLEPLLRLESKAAFPLATVTSLERPGGGGSLPALRYKDYPDL